MISPTVSSHVFKRLVLSDQKYKTPEYSIYYNNKNENWIMYDWND